MYKIVVTFAILALIAGCSKSTKSESHGPGKITMQMVSLKTAKMVAAADSGDTVIEDSIADDTAAIDSTPQITGADIELGTLKSSKAFYFIIKNVGEALIESLTITTDNPQITMTPGYIPVLETDGNSSLTQIAELDVTHGTDLGTKLTVKPLLPHGAGITTVIFDGVSDGERFHEEFTIGYSAIYVNMETVNTFDARMGEEMEFQGEECSFFIIDNHDATIEHNLHAGDTLYAGTSPEPIADNFNYLAFAKSDCVIKNQLPKELQ